MHILVAGEVPDEDAELREQMRACCQALGEAISTHGHVLLSGCRSELDKMIAVATYEYMTSRGVPDCDKRVISYVLKKSQTIHGSGTIIKSRLADWDLFNESLYIPEQIQQAEAVILLGGGEGTLRAANWARIAHKPLLPITAFGGAAETVYGRELNDFDAKYAGFVDRLEYEQLNAVKDDWKERAADIIALAEKVALPRSVLVIMSYAGQDDVEDAYDSFAQVCRDLDYRCERVTADNAGERILPEILERIKRAGFVIVDLTGLSRNVFYELGYADGAEKKVIVTAKQGTELPFDVKDIPTIFWSGQRQLREDLKTRIINVVKPATAAASPPTGRA